MLDIKTYIHENDNRWADTGKYRLAPWVKQYTLPPDMSREVRQSNLGLPDVRCVFNTLHISSRVSTEHRHGRVSTEGMGWDGLETTQLNLMRWLYNGHRDTLQDSYNSPAYNGNHGVRQRTISDGYGEGGINPLWCLPAFGSGASSHSSRQAREDIPLTESDNESIQSKPKQWSRNAINKAIKRSKKARLSKP